MRCFDGLSLLKSDSDFPLHLQIISGLQNFDRSNVASVVTAADKVGILCAAIIFHALFTVELLQMDEMLCNF